MHLSVECLVEMQRSVMHRSQLLSFSLFCPFYPSNKIYAFDSIEFGWSPCMLCDHLTVIFRLSLLFPSFFFLLSPIRIYGFNMVPFEGIPKSFVISGA